MMRQIEAGPTDDQNFIGLLNVLIKALVADRKSDRVWIIQIDNWFDKKWMAFSGYGTANSGIPLDRFDIVKIEVRQKELTFPPFNPNRVLAQWSYVRTDHGYIESALPRSPHSSGRNNSDESRQRYVQDFDRSACFIWYSSNTRANDRASIMVYNSYSSRCDS